MESPIKSANSVYPENSIYEDFQRKTKELLKGREKAEFISTKYGLFTIKSHPSGAHYIVIKNFLKDRETLYQLNIGFLEDQGDQSEIYFGLSIVKKYQQYGAYYQPIPPNIEILEELLATTNDPLSELANTPPLNLEEFPIQETRRQVQDFLL